MGKLLRIVSILFFFLTGAVLLRVFFLGSYPDFSVYYAGSSAVTHGLNPYLRQSTFFSNYVYPPFVGLFFVPFTIFSLSFASRIFTLFSIICLFAGIYCLLTSVKRFSFTSFFLLSSVIMLTFPVKFTLGMGQINLLLFFMLALAMLQLERGRELSAGILLGLSFALKFFPVLFLPYLLWRKKYFVFSYSLLVFLLFSWIGFLVLGEGAHRSFIHSVMPGIMSSYQSDYYNQSLSGFFARLQIPSSEGLYLKTFFSVILLGITALSLLTRKRTPSILFDLSILVTVSLIINPFSWQHHFVWLIIPFLLTFFRLKSLWSITGFWFIVAVIFVGMNFKEPERLSILFQSHVLFGTIFLWLIQLRLTYQTIYDK